MCQLWYAKHSSLFHSDIVVVLNNDLLGKSYIYQCEQNFLEESYIIVIQDGDWLLDSSRLRHSPDHAVVTGLQYM